MVSKGKYRWIIQQISLLFSHLHRLLNFEESNTEIKNTKEKESQSESSLKLEKNKPPTTMQGMYHIFTIKNINSE